MTGSNSGDEWVLVRVGEESGSVIAVVSSVCAVFGANSLGDNQCVYSLCERAGTTSRDLNFRIFDFVTVEQSYGT